VTRSSCGWACTATRPQCASCASRSGRTTPCRAPCSNLFYAHSLVSYAEIYSWEIRGRERVASDDEVDLKRWTLEQIVAEANRAFGRVWAERGRWGESSIGELARYIDQNDYPARSATLRDAVSYLWVELLADSSLWRPGQANQLYQLDVAALVAGDPARSGALDLADPRSTRSPRSAPCSTTSGPGTARGRPRRRWRRGSSGCAGCTRRLRAPTTSAPCASTCRGCSRASTAATSGGRWARPSSPGCCRGEDAADSLVRARQEALAGAERHPDSIGGQRCRHLVAAIEAPSFSLEAMALDGAHRHSIRVTHRNLDALHFRAYAFDLADTVTGAKDYNLLPGYREVPQWIATAAGRGVDRGAAGDHRLPRPRDLRDAADGDPGAYLVVVSARRDFASEGNQMTALNMVIGDLVLVTSQAGGGWRSRRAPGAATAAGGRRDLALPRRLAARPPPGRPEAHRGRRPRALHELRPAAGPVLPARALAGPRGGRHQLPVRLRGAFTRGREQRFPLHRPLGVPAAADHPLEVVAFRGGGDEQRYRTSPRSAVTVTLTDPTARRWRPARSEPTSSARPRAASRSRPGRLLGAWYLRSSLAAPPSSGGGVQAPTFEVAVDDPAQPLRLNRAASLAGSRATTSACR